ncbi:MAG: hypothetical protein ACKVS9_00965 [Phycisphaerae bacterium]
METCIPCIAELIIALVDLWLLGKAAESRDPRFDRPEQRNAFRFWITLLVVGLIVLGCVVVLRFYGWPIWGPSGVWWWSR